MFKRYMIDQFQINKQKDLYYVCIEKTFAYCNLNIRIHRGINGEMGFGVE